MATTYDTKKCKRCDGTGEEYRPEVQCNDGPWLDCIGCHGYGFEQSDESLRHCTAVLAESWRVGWPKIFKGDVEYHDMRALAERDPRRGFAWMLRETGSSIIVPGEERADQHDDPMRVWSGFIRAQSDECICYWWDGASLKGVDHEDLIKLLADEYGPKECAA